jgi:hypothetical protein
MLVQNIIKTTGNHISNCANPISIRIKTFSIINGQIKAKVGNNNFITSVFKKDIDQSKTLEHSRER